MVEEGGDGGGGERGVAVKEGDGSGVVGEEDLVVGVGSRESEVELGVEGGGRGEVEGGEFEGGDGEGGALGVVEEVEDGSGAGNEEEEEQEDQEEVAAEGGGAAAAAAAAGRLGAVGGATGARKLGFCGRECWLWAAVGGGFGRRMNPISHGGFAFRFRV